MRAFLNCLCHASQLPARQSASPAHERSGYNRAFGLTGKIDIASLSGHELAQSICGSVLLRYAANRRLDVCLSRRATSAWYVWRDARFRQHDDAGWWLDSTRRGLADCIWITNA